MDANKLFIYTWLIFIAVYIPFALLKHFAGIGYKFIPVEIITSVIVLWLFLKNKPDLRPNTKLLVLWDFGRVIFNRVGQFAMAAPILLTPSWFWDMTWNGAYVFDSTLCQTFGMMPPETGHYLPAAPEFLLAIMKGWYAFGVLSILLIDVLILLKYRKAIQLRFMALLLTVVMTIPGLIQEFGAGHLGLLDAVGIGITPFITFWILTRAKQT